MSTHGGETHAPTGPARRSSTRGQWGRRVLLGLALVGLLVVLLSAWQAFSAYRHLRAAQDRVPALRAQLEEGDTSALSQNMAALRDDTTSARRAMEGPHWALFSALPGVGRNVEAVRTVTATVDELVSTGLSDLVDVSDEVSVDDLRPVNGRIDVDLVRTLRPAAASAWKSAVAADRDLAEIDADDLMATLEQPVTDLSAQVRDLRSATRSLALVTRLLPPMLGQDGPRHYLVLVQNNAEPRALGGIPGAAILLRANDGKITLVRQLPASALGNPERPVARLTPPERALYRSQLGRYFQNVTATPDFPRAAQLARKMWQRSTGRQVDGVLSIDPVGLELLLDATGPVELPDGRVLNGDNAARTLLNQVYIDFPDPVVQDRYFAGAAAAIFNKLLGGDTDAWSVGRALGEAARQNRLMVWSADRSEQRHLSGTGVSGELRGRSGTESVVGVYLHDRSAAKIGYYEDLDVRVTDSACTTADTGRADLTVTVRSRVPRNVARLPDYLTGGGNAVQVGRIRSEVYVYAPPGARVAAVRSRADKPLVTTTFHKGLHVASHVVELGPRERVRLSFRLEGIRGEDVTVRTTPGPAEGRFETHYPACTK